MADKNKVVDAVAQGRGVTFVLSRALGIAISRVGWGLADQSLSSPANFALGVAVARNVAPSEFGAFSIAFGGRLTE